MSWIGERILLALSRKPGSPDYPGGTELYTLSNALDFATKTVPNFIGIIRGKSLLDYGCGPGWQAVAMRQKGARSVVAVDIQEKWLSRGRALAREASVLDGIRFEREIPRDLIGSFDVVISLSSFEHFRDPRRELENMKAAARPGGTIVVSFAEPWLSNNGSHMGFFTRMRWVNVFFSERTVMRVRSHFRNDGATRYEDVLGGLNKMTLARFEKIIADSGLVVDFQKHWPTRGIPLAAHLPLVREFLVSGSTCIFKKPVTDAVSARPISLKEAVSA